MRKGLAWMVVIAGCGGAPATQSSTTSARQPAHVTYEMPTPMRLTLYAGRDAAAPTAAREGLVAAAQPSKQSTALKYALMIPNDVENAARQSAIAVVWGVFFASIQGGGGQKIVTTGTITQSATNQFTYAATPTDRLVVQPAQGKPAEFTGIDLQGSPKSPNDFLSNDHSITFTVKIDGLGELTLQQVSQGRASQARATGTYDDGTRRYKFDLASTGQTAFENSSQSGSEYDDDEQITGSATGDDLALEVAESWHYVDVTPMRETSHDHEATQAVRKIASKISIGGKTYTAGCQFSKEYADGKPNLDDTGFGASGEIDSDGKTIGQCKMRSHSFVIELAGGETIEVDRW